MIMKCFERLIKGHNYFLTISDPEPAAVYIQRLNCVIHNTLPHKDIRRENYVNMLFVDYSSAFNTTNPSKVATKHKDMGPVQLDLQMWGHVPMSTIISKFADDTGLLGLISDNEDKASPGQLVPGLQPFCEGQQDEGAHSGLWEEAGGELSHPLDHQVLVEKMDSSRYLCVCITVGLSWSSHVNTSVKGLQTPS